MAKLTPKQQAFVNAYNGNATEAAIKAGYSKTSARQVGADNMSKAYILEAIKSRTKKRENLIIATREERQAFWTRVFSGQELETKYDSEGNPYEVPPSMQNRLKASELLGRSEADFTEKVHGDMSITVKRKEYKPSK